MELQLQLFVEYGRMFVSVIIYLHEFDPAEDHCKTVDWHYHT